MTNCHVKRVCIFKELDDLNDRRFIVLGHKFGSRESCEIKHFTFLKGIMKAAFKCFGCLK